VSDAEDHTVSRAQLRKRKLRHGFKAAAKRHSLELRRVHGYGETDSVDCYDLADEAGIEIVRLSELPASTHTHHLTEIAPEVMSAATVKHEDKVAIWINNHHSRPRQMANLAHEIGHVALDHQHTPVLNDGGCREHDADIEAEADYFGSVLLVTDRMALDVFETGEPIDEAAERCGVSRQLMQWRVNDSGAAKRVQRVRRHSKSSM
jgi:hypothetical protein